ncbi:MAG TPA: hypothetical protein O0X01_02180 [Methanocorpusculum sp.]|nr:hypothetical protein [Methanocorpusculum sp.]
MQRYTSFINGSTVIFATACTALAASIASPVVALPDAQSFAVSRACSAVPCSGPVA